MKCDEIVIIFYPQETNVGRKTNIVSARKNILLNQLVANIKLEWLLRINEHVLKLNDCRSGAEVQSRYLHSRNGRSQTHLRREGEVEKTYPSDQIKRGNYQVVSMY